MLANDDPAQYLLDHGWVHVPHGTWELLRQDGLFCLIDRGSDPPRSLYEPCLAGTIDVGMQPVEFHTVEGAVRWIARHTAQELRARADQAVAPWETR